MPYVAVKTLNTADVTVDYLDDIQGLELIDDRPFITNMHLFREGFYENEIVILDMYNRRVLAEGFPFKMGEVYIDNRYLKNYKIYDMKEKTYHDVEGGFNPGYIIHNVKLTECGNGDFVFRVYRHDTGKFVGEYELYDIGTMLEANIAGLFLGKTYDLVLFDRNTKIESRVASNRTPISMN